MSPEGVAACIRLSVPSTVISHFFRTSSSFDHGALSSGRAIFSTLDLQKEKCALLKCEEPRKYGVTVGNGNS
jgi:hypothetical protein